MLFHFHSYRLSVSNVHCFMPDYFINFPYRIWLLRMSMQWLDSSALMEGFLPFIPFISAVMWLIPSTHPSHSSTTFQCLVLGLRPFYWLMCVLYLLWNAFHILPHYLCFGLYFVSCILICWMNISPLRLQARIIFF